MALGMILHSPLLLANRKCEMGNWKAIVCTSLINAVLDAFIDSSIVQNEIKNNSTIFPNW